MIDVVRLIPRLLLPLLLVACLPLPARGGTVERTSVHDNTLFQDADGDTSNGSGTGVFCGRNSQGRVRRAVIAFDLVGALPADTQLDSVRLELHLDSASDQSERVLHLHRLLVGWGEGASASGGGGGAPAQAGDATWLHAFYPGTLWAVPGGDFASGLSASTTVGGEGTYAWRSQALTDDVRAWLDQAATNFGWILLGDESEPGTARRIDSRESTTTSWRPRLVLHYSPTTPALPDSWGRLKSRFR